MSQTRHQQSGGGTGSRVESLSPERAGISGTLRLRAEDAPPVTNNGDSGSNRRIRWSDDVVDNEGMGKKSSKVCCIYHKPRPVGESSSESESSDSSSSDSDSDSEAGDQSHPGGTRSQKHSSAQPTSRGRSTCSHDHRKGKGKPRKPSPNAYEKMPKPSKGR